MIKFLVRAFVFGCLYVFLLIPVSVWAASSDRIRDGTTMQSRSVRDLNDGSADLIVDSDSQNTEIINSNYSQTPGQGTGSLSTSFSIHILGDVKNPGVFKIPISSRVTDIIGQSLPSRKNLRMIEIRHEGEESRSYDLYRYYYSGDLSQNPYLRDNDVIFVPQSKGTIRIEGPVARPSMYEIKYEKNVYDILKLAGGTTKAMAKDSPIRVIRFDDTGQKQIVDVDHSNSELKKQKIQAGDIIIVPDVINSKEKFDYSVESIPGENLVYPTAVPEVFVLGAVRSPGPYPYKSHFRAKEYIGYAGASANAKLRRIKVVRDNKRKNITLDGNVEAGDVLIIKPRVIDETVKYLGIVSTFMTFTISVMVFKDKLD